MLKNKPKTEIVVFKGDAKEKSLDQRMLESCCSFHIGVDDLVSSDKPFKYAMTGRGVVKFVCNKIGLFAINTDSVPGLPIINEGLVLSLPKIPYEMLLKTIAFFKEVMRKHSNAEAMVQFYFDEESDTYFMNCPEQEVSGARVAFKRDSGLDETYTLVMDIHSHNTMSAFFSSVDDADEKENRIYGVVGKLNNVTPEMRFRISVGDDHKEIDVFDIFENPFADVAFPESWLDKCTPPPKFRTTTYQGGKYKPTNNQIRTSSYSTYPSNYYDYDYEDFTDDTFYRSSWENNFYDPLTLDVATRDAASLVDLVKDILTRDADIVAQAILEEKLEDDIIDFLTKKSVHNYTHRR